MLRLHLYSKKRISADGLKILRSAIDAVSAEKAVRQAVELDKKTGRLRIEEHSIEIQSINKIYVAAAGKAAPQMAAAIEDILGEFLTGGLVVSKYGHSIPLEKCDIIESAHPVPDKNSIEASKQFIRFFQNADAPNNLLIILISGGASSLLCRPADGISLKDVVALNEILLGSGADIHEMNTIRRHVSAIKGGRLLQHNRLAQLITLAVSDVVGDSPESIGSGVTVPDPTTYKDALQIIHKYSIEGVLPVSILRHIQLGIEAKVPETLKTMTVRESTTAFSIILNNRSALCAAQSAAEKLGYRTTILSSSQTGGIVSCAESFYRSLPVDSGKVCYLSGGECTVNLPPNAGKGGRNQFFTWQMMRLLWNDPRPFWFASIGTDGTDGPTDAAGAWLDGQVINDYKKIMNLPEYTRDALSAQMDFYNLWQKLGNLIYTGPTGTNVMDVQIFLCGLQR